MTSGRSIWLIRWSLSSALLLAGVFALSFPPPPAGIWWLSLNWHPATLWLPLPSRALALGLAIAVMTMAIFLERRTLIDQLRAALASPATDFTWALWLALYTLCIAGARELINASYTSSHALQLFRVCCTALVSLIATTSWGLGVIPARFWNRWFRENYRRVPAMVGLAVLSYVLIRHFTPVVMTSAPGFMQPLQRTTLFISAALLHLFARHIVFQPNTSLIGTSDFAVYLAPKCSGVEGITLFVFVFPLYLALYRRHLRIARALLLLPLGIVLLWCLNIVRIVAMILIGSWSSLVGVDGFHSVAGWFLFNAATLGIIAASQRLTYFSKEHETSCSSPRPANNVAAYLFPLLSIIAIGMAVTPFSLKLSYPVQTVGGMIVLWMCAGKIFSRPRWPVSWSAILIGVVVYAVWLFASRRPSSSMLSGGSVLQTEVLSGASRYLWIVLRLAGATLVAPIAEEMAFRGYLLRRLVAADFESVPYHHFTWFSFLGSSLAFGAFHRQWYLGIFAGMAFALSVYRRGRLSDAVVSHSIANSLLAIDVLQSGEWWLWG